MSQGRARNLTAARTTRRLGLRLRRLSDLLLGWVLVISGLLITPLPLPVGLLLLVLGLALLIRRSQWVRGRIMRLRGRYPVISARLRRLEPRLYRSLASALRSTDPDRVNQRV